MDADDIRKYGIGCGFIMMLFLGFIYMMPFMWRSRTLPMQAMQPTGEAVQAVEAQPRNDVPPPPKPVETPKTPLQILEDLSRGKDSAVARELEVKYSKEAAGDRKRKGFAEARELALKYLREGSAEEKLAAIKFLPPQNMRLFEEAFNGNSHEEAMEIYSLTKEIQEQCAGMDQKDLPSLKDSIRYMKEKMQEMDVRRFKDLLAAGDEEKINAEIGLAWKNPEAVLPEKETLEYLAGAWEKEMEKNAGKGSEAAQAALEKAAEFAVQDVHSITYWKYRSGPIEEALGRRHSYQELMDLGRKSLQQDKPLLALGYISAAIRKSSAADSKVQVRVGKEDWLERQRLLSESIVGTACLADDGKLRWLPPDSNFENKVEILFQLAANYVRDVDRMKQNAEAPEKKYAVAIKAWDGLLKLYLRKLHRIISRNEPHRIISYCDEILYEKSGIYMSFLAECFGPEKILEGVPENLLKELEKTSKTPKDKTFALTEMVRRKKYAPQFEGKEEFLKASMQAKYQEGSRLLKEGKYPEAFMFFREILREYPDSVESEDIRKQISSKIEEARKSKDFNAVYYLASFFIGEMKRMAIPEEVKQKLAGCLEDAAEFYRNGAPMSRAFMLSLLSDVLSGTKKGDDARDEAMKIGFDAVSKLPMKEQEKPALVLPSTVKGCSIEAMKNSTPYHLMAFYNGLEKFFVRLNPYSRGSLAVLDGEYEIAVIVTSERVIPYRSKRKYEKQFLLQNYFISEPGRNKTDEYPDEFMGKFTILRMPGGFENAVVEPESGIIIQKSR